MTVDARSVFRERHCKVGFLKVLASAGTVKMQLHEVWKGC